MNRIKVYKEIRSSISNFKKSSYILKVKEILIILKVKKILITNHLDIKV